MDTITFESGATFHFSAWSVDGSAPSTFVQVEASTPGVAFDLVNDTAGVFTSTYVIFSDAHASADALWTAGTGCEDWGGNVGLFDEDSPAVGDRIFFDPGATYNITGWTVDGAPGAAVLITSNPPTATHYLVRTLGGPFTSDWCVISHSDASPDEQWAAGANSFDAGDNRNGGWFSSALSLVGAATLSGPGVAASALLDAPGVGAFSAIGPAVSGVLVQGSRGVVFVPLAAPGASGVSGEGSGGVVAESVSGPGASGAVLEASGILASVEVAAPDVSGVSGEASSALGSASISVELAGIIAEALAAALSERVLGPGVAAVSGEGSTGLAEASADVSVAGAALGSDSARADLETLAPDVAAALVEACRIVGEIESAELHWHGYSRRGAPYVPILVHLAEWPSPDSVVLRWAAPQTLVASWPSPQTITLRWAEPQIFTILWEGGPWPD